MHSLCSCLQPWRKNQVLTSKAMGDKKIEIKKLMENKRSPCSIDHSSLTTFGTKRQKADISISPKERKEKLGERILALQQLVSPYGKTDTASVLLEAMEYIQFLHEQVKVLSAPYLQSTPTNMQEVEEYSLRSKGLCLVPTSWTTGVAGSNGADIWAPIKTSAVRLDRGADVWATVKASSPRLDNVYSQLG